MASLQQPFLAAHIQPFQAELAHRLEQGKPRIATRLLSSTKLACIDERRPPFQRVKITFSIADGVDRFQRAPASEDREPPEEGLLLRGEQIMAPGDGVAQGPLAGWGISRP